MITLNFEKAPAWVAFIIGIVVGFFVQPYVMEVFNNSLIFENQTLKDKIVQLEQQLSKSSEEFVQSPNPPLVQPLPSPVESHFQNKQTFNGVEITLSSCQKIEKEIIESHESSIACQFTINQPYDFMTIYAYGTVLKAQQEIISYVDAVQATDVEIIKTEEGEISSWKLLTPQTVSLTIRFWIPEEVAMEGDSVELFVKPALKQATTVKFAP
ncbi:hypothetical protein, partial [Candidatus Parabeggiatoa sp. HSG14]|uniref:hypothetical protein n=1 Tax=Candidatus Parabeggiatoa sp. HSG14 TaxID=3055593 RepID=UPI0025A6DFC6|nr:hypothetical protein [Thiotrichales bacterium HSG14]